MADLQSTAGSAHLSPQPEPVHTSYATVARLNVDGQNQENGFEVTQAPGALVAKMFTPDRLFVHKVQNHINQISCNRWNCFQQLQSSKDFLDEIKALDIKYQGTSKAKGFAARIWEILHVISRFMGLFAPYYPYLPDASTLVINSFQTVFELSLNFFGYFEKLTNMMELIKPDLIFICECSEPQFEQMPQVRMAVTGVYGELTQLYMTIRNGLEGDRGEISRDKLCPRLQIIPLSWDFVEKALLSAPGKFSNRANIVAKAAQVQGKISSDHKRQLQESIETIENQWSSCKGEKRREILKWLSDSEFERTHRRHALERLENTGQWLLDDKHFKDWVLQRNSSLLWCHGTAGTGKTTLTSMVLQNLHALREYEPITSLGIAYAYCSYQDQQDPENYIRNYIKQLLRQLEDIDLPSELVELHDVCWRKTITPDYLELLRLFMAASKRFGETFIIFDALDELTPTHRPRFLRFLEDIVSHDDSGVIKLFITSRRELDIEEAFKSPQTIQVEAGRDDKDIEIYVKFLCAKLQLSCLCHQSSEFIRDALRTLPNDLEETYETIILDIDKDQARGARARKLLMWVAYAKIPLALEELAEAIAIIPGLKNHSELEPLIVDDVKTLINDCGNLLVVGEKGPRPNSDPEYDLRTTGDVGFVHYSAQEFLLSASQEIRNPETHSIITTYKSNLLEVAHEAIARCCLTYLLFAKEFDGCRFEYGPFVNYAITYWMDHIRLLEDLNEEFWQLLSNFLRNGHLFFYISESEPYTHFGTGHKTFHKSTCENFSLSTLALLFDLPLATARIDQDNPGGNSENPLNSTAIHWAVRRSSFAAVESLINRGCDLNCLDSDGNLPIMLTSRPEIVRLLLNSGADVNAQGGFNGNALQNAVVCCNELFPVLLERGADVNAQGGFYGCALQAAIGDFENGYIKKKMIEILLDKGADVNIQGGKHSTHTPLQAAVECGTKELVELLLDRGADPNARGGNFECALQNAVWHERDDVVTLLLERGADVNIRGGDQGSALQAAAVVGAEEVFKLLLERGADVNAEGGQYGYALQAAAQGGSREMVELLLDKGADVNAKGGYHRYALQAACWEDHGEVIALLLERGADVNLYGGEYWSALQAAASRGNEALVQRLLRKGADVNAQGGRYGTALQAAAASGVKTLVELLLEWGANVNATCGKNGCALQAAALCGNNETVALLLEKGADPNIQGGRLGNPLLAAVKKGRIESIRLLLEKGADINAQGADGQSALQIAAGGVEEVFMLLLQRGADVNAECGAYGSPLQAAVVCKNQEFAELLLERGVDMSAHGGFALQSAAWFGHEEIVKLLLARGADVNAKGGHYQEGTLQLQRYCGKTVLFLVKY